MQEQSKYVEKNQSHLYKFENKFLNTITININRIEHLLKLYRLSKEDILMHINQGRKIPVSDKDVFKSEIKTSLLKKIDSIFNKGLNYYLDPNQPKALKEESIFFRKDQFSADLSLGSKQRVTQFEEEKIELSALAKLSNLNLERILENYSIQDNPREVAFLLRGKLYPGNGLGIKEFLKVFISKLADHNIGVFEFVDTHNKREKANINGFFLSPNAIVLKRMQNSLKREVFTLAHELGHYLLNEEEIDEIDEYFIENKSINKIEKWCNEFAYYFLVGEYDKFISNLDKAVSQNNFQDDAVTNLTKEIPLSKIAIYTRLVLINKISQKDYNLVKDNIYTAFKEREEALQSKKQLDKENGIVFQARNPVPIISPLHKKTLQSAFYEGVIDEREFCRRLNIKAEKIDSYLQ